LLEGEDLGFAAYVYDLKEQKPSDDVKNLYCQVLDSDRQVVKERLLLVEQGRSTGTFAIDSLFQPGNYTVRAFTNWMRNFENPHYFEASIKIIAPTEKEATAAFATSTIGVQILPEGGHLVQGVMSTAGISVLDSRGNALNGATIKLLENDVEICEIHLENTGLGRFAFRPVKDKNYTVMVTYNNRTTLTQLPQIIENGLLLAVREGKEALFVELNTNAETLSRIKGDNYIIAVNSNNKLKLYDKKIKDLTNLVALKLTDLKPGMNQITLFSKDKKVIGQRLYFNYNGFKTFEMEDIELTRKLETLYASIKFEDFENARVSIAVHTSQTVAIDKSQSILSSFKLRPYIKGEVQNPLDYFKNVTPRVKAAMDNLLLCKGWVMYDWDDVFNENRTFKYSYERGITVKANFDVKKFKSVVIYPSGGSDLTTLDLKDNDVGFTLTEYVAMGKEQLTVSAIRKKGRVEKVTMYPQFVPAFIPSFLKSKKLNPIETSGNISDHDLKPLIKRAEALDTITLVVNKEKARREKLRDRSTGRIDFFDDSDRRNEILLVNYINRIGGLRADVSNGNLSIRPVVERRFTNLSEPPVVIILDNTLYRDLNMFISFDMSTVDYIEIIPNDPRYPNGVAIRIITDPLLSPFKLNSQTTSSYDLPLTFTAPAKFYRPSYYSYTDLFFEKFGVIDWQGDVEIKDGNGTFSMPYLGINKLLFHIQGWANDGTLIDEYREVEVIGSAVKY
jgi:hypothetical protein